MEKYLLQYAEPETAALDGLPESLVGPGFWENVMVIPACNESTEFLRTAPPCDGRSLMILVINETVSAPHEVSLSNQALADAVLARFQLQWQSGRQFPGFSLSLLRDPLFPRDVLLVDRFSDAHKLPLKGGVGHARKVGVDLAASLIHRQRICSPWIHCTDADVQLPETYFSCIKQQHDISSGNAALVYPFHHNDDELNGKNREVILATQLYELSLRYYVAGMRYAGSPYAFHTIGSTMAVNAAHYASVRGFPKRAAGEDFYLLNKLAKVGSVLELSAGSDCRPILIESRRSDRVPFGTGAAVNKITDLADPVQDFSFYHPVVFELLQLWLQSLNTIWKSGSSDVNERIFAQRADDPEQSRKHQALLEGLKIIKTGRALEHAFRQSKSPEQFSRQMHTWFDAFRTLKLVHYLRDFYQPNISYATLQTNSSYQHLLAFDTELSAFAAGLAFVSQG